MGLYPEYVIDEQATIEDADIEKVYDACLSWLVLKKARILEQSRLEFIKAQHGMGRRERIQKHGKIFLIKLSQNGKNIIINFKTPPISWIPPQKSPVYPIYWTEFVEDLWRHIGVPIDEDLLRRLYPFKNIRRMIIDNLITLFMMVVLFGLVIYLSQFGLSWMIILGIVGLLVTAYPSLYEVQKLRKKLHELYSAK